jgi:hypothetical protein
MIKDLIQRGDLIVMDGVCYQVEDLSPEAEVHRTCALLPLTVGFALPLPMSHVPHHMLRRLIALGEAMLARNVNAV